ncbi:DUF4373 domain-containing protein [bacterium]|nr:DUF4373 domain-containing protein [bacterium]
MAKSKESFYFSHDCGACRDLKIIKLRRKFGWEGYGVFWAVIEALRETSNYEISLEDADNLLFEFGIKREIFDYLFKCGLLTKEGNVFYSESLKRRMDLKECRIKTNRENGKKGGRPKKEENRDCDNNATNNVIKFQDVPENPLPPELDKFTSKSFTDYGVSPQDIQNALGQPTMPVKESERPLILALLSEGCEPVDFKEALNTTIKEGKAVRSVKYLQSRIRDARDMRKAGTLGKKPMTDQEIYAENVRLDALRTLGYKA